MIQVLTHNGLLPSQGGKRIGYQVDDTLFLIATQGVYSVSALLAGQRVASQTTQTATQAPAKQPLFLSGLSYCNRYGDCGCGQRDNEARPTMTDQGEKWVVTCRNCGRKMRVSGIPAHQHSPE
jgi:hypothetical protein